MFPSLGTTQSTLCVEHHKELKLENQEEGEMEPLITSCTMGKSRKNRKEKDFAVVQRNQRHKFIGSENSNESAGTIRYRFAIIINFDGLDRPNEDDDEQALSSQFKGSITKLNGKYQVCWPWKESKNKLKNHYGMGFGRLKTLVKKLRNNEEILQRYDIIRNQLQTEVIEEVSPKMNQEGLIHYLPHHEVISPYKPTTKLRIVHDASAHLKGTKSLNEVLYRGPIMLPDFIGILLRHWLAVKKLMRNVIEATILAGSFKGEDVLIPRIPMIPTQFDWNLHSLSTRFRVNR
ncbi:unnamed protein product [Onchocerca ochengi]|uniref:Uncharacterized protein n=1 Tax=Onchocerca ochengi TaxID=42157 RepID=A0A182ELN0_ONCOC|nr:unnamed protein product [Onchocerca ochengi]